MNDVTIKVYVESSKFCSKKKTLPGNRTNAMIPLPSNHPTNGRTRGYDRRAQLLAYARKLRCCNGESPKWPPGKSSPQNNSMKRRWQLSFDLIRLSCRRLFCRKNKEQWRYEHIATEDYNKQEGWFDQPKRKTRKAASNGKRNSQFCEKLRSFLKPLSCFCQCKGGY